MQRLAQGRLNGQQGLFAPELSDAVARMLDAGPRQAGHNLSGWECHDDARLRRPLEIADDQPLRFLWHIDYPFIHERRMAEVMRLRTRARFIRQAGKKKGLAGIF